MKKSTEPIRGRMSFDEFARFKLHALYRKYGYKRYKMDKFEEYELYLRNRDFLGTENLITFSDRDGKLLAMKPDLTLSIVRNFRGEPGQVQKVFYSENVYRTRVESRSHCEMAQTGLECLGSISADEIREVTLLAAKSLACVSDRFVLQLSHMGILTDLLKKVEDSSVREQLARFIGEKNEHDLRNTASEAGIAVDVTDALAALISAYGSPEEALSRVERLPLGEGGKRAVSEFRGVLRYLEEQGFGGEIRVDFSVVNDMSYYSGIVFRGFSEDVPVSVLSGGQYDGLMSRNGKRGGALGFAVSLDAFLRMGAGTEDVDVVLLPEGGAE